MSSGCLSSLKGYTMKRIALSAGVSFVLCLGGINTVLAADEPVSAPNHIVAQSGPTEKEELLLFYEEKDLVTATKRATPLRKAPAIATIITADEIRAMGARNLLDVCRRPVCVPRSW